MALFLKEPWQMVDALHLGFMRKYILQIEELVNKKEIKIQYRVFF